jgi:cell division initiation protein
MELSPIDIEQKTFRVALRGYAEEEVDQFLDEIVVAIREYERQLRDANERVAVLEDQLRANLDTEERIKKTLIIAQRTADQVVQEARGEAQQLLNEARTKASEVETERIQERENLVADLDRMRSSVAGLKDRIMGLADSTLVNLDAIEEDLVAAQPEKVEPQSWDEPPREVAEGHEDDAPQESWDREPSERESSRESWDHEPSDRESSREFREHGPDQGEAEGDEHQPEESTGQVYLGSRQRPWDREDSEG